MNKNRILYMNDNCRSKDAHNIFTGGSPRFDSKIEFFSEDGERLWEPLHNKTVIAGGALTLQKLFSLNPNSFNNTPTYDEELNLDDAADSNAYPTINIRSGGSVIGSTADETQRVILGFCMGIGGAGLDASDVFEVNYASWIDRDHILPFRYPLQSADSVDENIYKGKQTLTDNDGNSRCAYYFKEFSNTPVLTQNFVSTIGTFSDAISPETVYSATTSADIAQSYVELHLKVTKNDFREYFIANGGLEQAKVNQLSLVYGWKKSVTRNDKLDSNGNRANRTYEVYQQVRPFSICNFPTEILSDRDKTISIIYTLYC